MRPNSLQLQLKESDLLPCVGDTVKVNTGYQTGYDRHGKAVISYLGTISEVINDRLVSIAFPGYHTRYVDFGLNELA